MMRKTWSVQWKGSSQPRKQRKYRYNAPLHVRRKFLSAHLSQELRKGLGMRSMPVRKGDEVLVMRGEFRGIKGTVERVDVKAGKVYTEAVKDKKVDGSEVQRALQPSSLMITRLPLDDKKRQAAIERAKPAPAGKAGPEARAPQEGRRKVAGHAKAKPRRARRGGRKAAGGRKGG
jgi:large subunit ribosomal protein L24